MMKDLSGEWGNKLPYYDLYPIETKIIFESQIQESTYIEILEYLNERQKRALDYIKIKKIITSKQYQQINKVSKRTAWKDINELLEESRIIKKSSGAHTYYTLK